MQGKYLKVPASIFAAVIIAVGAISLISFNYLLQKPPQHDTVYRLPSATNTDADANQEQSTDTPQVLTTQESSPAIEQFTADIETLNYLYGAWVDKLQQSLDPQDIVLYAVIAKKSDPAEQEALFLDAYALAPDNLLLLLSIGEFCLGQPSSAICSPDMLDALDRVTAGTGMADDFKMIHRYNDGDLDGALALLDKLGTKPNYDLYNYLPYIQALGESLHRFGGVRNFEFLETARGLTAAKTSNKGAAIFTICEKQQQDLQWRNTCAGFQERNRNTTSGKAIDNEILASLYEEYEDKKVQNSDWQMTETQWNRYLKLLSEKGSIDAMEYLLRLL